MVGLFDQGELGMGERENRRMDDLLGLVVDVDAGDPKGEVSSEMRRAIE